MCTIDVFVLIAKTLDHLNNKISCFVIHARYEGGDIAEKYKSRKLVMFISSVLIAIVAFIIDTVY